MEACYPLITGHWSSTPRLYNSPSSSISHHSLFLPSDGTMAKTIHPDRKKELIPFLQKNLGEISQREIARRLQVGKTTINRWAKELGFKQIKHFVNEDFFESWSEESAYILGYIYADGNIAWNPKKGYQTLTITAAAKDKDHLETIRLTLQSTKPLLYSQKTNSYRLIVNNKKIALKLMGLGVYPNKSKTVTFPYFIPKDKMVHFLRGIIDGDGCVYYLSRKRSPYFSIRIYSGSKDFLTKLAKIVEQYYSISAIVREVNESTFSVEYTCSRAKKLAKVIYNNSTIHMKRKYEVYKNNVLEEKTR